MEIVSIVSEVLYTWTKSVSIVHAIMFVSKECVYCQWSVVFMKKTEYLLSELCCIDGNGVCLLFMKFCMDLWSVYLISLKYFRMESVDLLSVKFCKIERLCVYFQSSFVEWKEGVCLFSAKFCMNGKSLSIVRKVW